jgi:hypothetical protein
VPPNGVAAPARQVWSVARQGTSGSRYPHRHQGRPEAVTSIHRPADGKQVRPVGYTHWAVAHCRHTRIVRAVALALILWLGLDLAATGVCCQDERLPGASASGLTTGCPGDSSTAPSQADACFCCAHVVGPAALHVPPPRQAAVVIPDVHPSDRPGIRPVLYHPPPFRS